MAPSACSTTRCRTILAGQMLRLGAMLVLLLVAGISALAPSTSAQQTRIYTTELTGVFSELTADHTIRVLERAERDQVPLLLIVNSPGGIDRAVRRLNHALLTSEVPVITWVGPEPEAQALSGGFLITLASHRTIMHPEAQIGAAPPPGIWDRISPEEREARIEFASQIANRTALVRERDADEVERIIMEQVVYSAEEAVAAGVADGIAETAQEALALVDGETVQTYIGIAELDTGSARLVGISMTWWEITLQTITHPSIAFSLLSVGLLLLIVELFNPGRLIAGIPGVISLVLAFVALGNLPVSWIGLALMLLAAILFIAELRTPWIGIMGALGLVAFVAGSLSFYRPWGAMSAFAPDVRIESWVIVLNLAGWVIILLLTLRAVFRARESEIEFRPIDLTGHQGIVIEPLTPRGVVRINEQEWAAVCDDGELDATTEVIVERMTGGIVHVVPIGDEIPAHSSTTSQTSFDPPPEPSR